MTGAKLGVVVLASAGTGKTFRLTNRVLRLLASGRVEPSGLLATTFTRKAAGEISQRVLSRLCAGAMTDEGLASLREHVDPQLTRERCTELLVRLVSSMHELNVQTIDSFFSRLAGSFALELGVPPGWRIIDDDEDDALREEAIGLALDRADRTELQRFIEMLHEGQASRRVREKLSEVIRQVYPAYLQTIGRPECWEVVQPEGSPLDEHTLDDAVRRIEQAKAPRNKQGKPNGHWINALAKAHQLLLASDWAGFVEHGLVKSVIEGDGTYHKLDCPDDIRDALAPLIAHARFVLIDALRKQNIATRNLLEQFDDAYRSLKRSTRGYRFEDVPRMLLEAGATGQLDELYFRLDARLRQVLFDEFQDTSVTQYELLEPILDELLSQGEGERGVFCVGDVKQSLYGWREAEPELLPSLPKRWTTLDVEELHVSYRSSQVVLDAVNDVFGSAGELPMFANEPFPASWSEGYTEHKAAKKLVGEVTLVCGPERDEEQTLTDQRHAHIAFAARRIASLVARAPNATIGVLFRTGRDIPRIIHELRVLGVEASAEGGGTLDDAPSVASALAHPPRRSPGRQPVGVPRRDGPARPARRSDERLRRESGRTRRGRAAVASDERGVRRRARRPARALRVEHGRPGLPPVRAAR